MASDTEICNVALSHLGVSKDIQDLDSDNSKEAAACRRFYEQSRDEVLEDFDWPFAETRVSLNLVTSNPNTDWLYSYQYPSDAVRLIKIPSGIRNDTQDSRIPYKVVHGTSGKLIYTDQQDAELIYTKRVTDVSRYTAKFRMALSLKIAGYIAARVTGGDPFNLQEKAEARYKLVLTQAQAAVMNEQRTELNPESEFIRARD